MGKRPDYRRFKRRRQKAGFVLLVSLAIVVLGGVMFLRAGAFLGAGAEPVGRVEDPTLAGAPETAAEVKEQGAVEERNEEAEGGKEEEATANKTEEEALPPAPDDPTMYLTIPKMGLYDNTLRNDDSTWALDQGAAKLPQTGFPWQNDANTYISAHRLGWPGTESYYQFYDLPLLTYGDTIYLTDANGTTYTYEVTEFLEVSPSDTWVTNPVGDGRDVISLQTCIENFGDYWTMGPTWSARYIVRGDKVAVDPA